MKPDVIMIGEKGNRISLHKDVDETQQLSEEECPKCGRKINWKVIRNQLGTPQYNGLCTNCHIVFGNREVPQITEGRELYRSGKRIKHWREIAHLPCDVQVGYFREAQKCKR